MTMEDAIRQLELARARADALHDSLAGMVAMVAEIGGFMAMRHQLVLAAAIDVLGVKPRTKTWPARQP